MLEGAALLLPLLVTLMDADEPPVVAIETAVVTTTGGLALLELELAVTWLAIVAAAPLLLTLLLLMAEVGRPPALELGALLLAMLLLLTVAP